MAVNVPPSSLRTRRTTGLRVWLLLAVCAVPGSPARAQVLRDNLWIANGSVNAVSSSGGTIYVGGDFVHVGGQSRLRIAALDATTGAATGWNPGADNSVRVLAVSGGTVYAGGFFTTIGGQPRNRIASLGVGTAVATAW